MRGRWFQWFRLLFLAMLIGFNAGCRAEAVTTPTFPSGIAGSSAGDSERETTTAAKAALERWLQAVRAGDCATLIDLLARSSPLWEGRRALKDACERGEDGVFAAWRTARVGPIVYASADRVAFRLEGMDAEAYAVMVREDGTWRYAGDVFDVWDPHPGHCRNDAILVFWGPVWDRATGIIVVLTLQNQSSTDLAWEAPCAVLSWADGRELAAKNCPMLTLAAGDVWRGELFFPKDDLMRGQPWPEPPRRIQLLNLSSEEGEDLHLTCTWRRSMP